MTSLRDAIITTALWHLSRYPKSTLSTLISILLLMVWVLFPEAGV